MSAFLESIFLRTLKGLKRGSLALIYNGTHHQFGVKSDSLRAVIHVHHPLFFRRALLNGDIGIGESFMAGEWTSPDVVSVIRLAVRNLDHLETNSALFSVVSRFANRLAHALRSNSITNSKKNIAAHYDLSNDFFRLFLDKNMMYSCAWYESTGDSLETAQSQKLDRICRKLDLKPGDRILEIGTGWGGFALHAARHYGAHVTTTTISQQQFDLASERFKAFDPAGERIHLLLQDYRKLEGSFDKIVSVEMFEAVGLAFYDEFFATCDRLLAPNGSVLMQTITMIDQKFPAYQRSCDWIQKYIFPGGELASMAEILKSTARATRLTLFNAEDMGAHYARTLREWRRRFLSHRAEVIRLGFDERFLSMWEFYLAYCEGAFLERHVSTTQVMFLKAYAQEAMMGEPVEAIRARSFAAK